MQGRKNEAKGRRRMKGRKDGEGWNERRKEKYKENRFCY